MNIVLVVTGLPDEKNPARSVYNLNYALALQEMGYAVNIIYLRSVYPGKNLMLKRNIKGVNVLELRCMLPVGGVKLKDFLSSFVIKWVSKYKALRRVIEKASIVHCINANGAAFADQLATPKRKPFLIQFVGSDVNYNLNQNLKLKAYRRALENAASFTFNSGKLAEAFKEKCIVKKSTSVIYRGVKLIDFQYSFSHIKKEIKILFLGGFPNDGNLKGGFTLLEALETLEAKLDASKVRLSVVIGGPNSKNHKTTLPLKHIHVIYLGAIAKTKVSDLMKESHVVIIPSLNEGLPNVLYEAMASGNLVMCTKVGGMPEFIEHDKTGMLFTPSQPSELSSLLDKIINKPELTETFAIAARKEIEKHDYHKFVESYLKTYHSILNLL